MRRILAIATKGNEHSKRKEHVCNFEARLMWFGHERKRDEDYSREEEAGDGSTRQKKERKTTKKVCGCSGGGHACGGCKRRNIKQ